LWIGSTLELSEPGSETVDVMSVTIDQPMDHTTDPGPSSSPSDTIELGCSELLAADSDEETEVIPDDDHLLSESEEETELPEVPTCTRWSVAE
jgi:hypothetical protein